MSVKKIGEIIFDETPTAASSNGVTSGGVSTAMSGKTDLSLIAPAFSTSSTYAVGDAVIYNGALYECNTAITTAGAWDSSKWTAKTVSTLNIGMTFRNLL